MFAEHIQGRERTSSYEEPETVLGRVEPEELLWKYRIPGKIEWKPISSWNSFTRQLKQRFGLRKNQLFGAPVISAKGVLYVNFNHSGSVYAFEIRSGTGGID